MPSEIEDIKIPPIRNGTVIDHITYTKLQRCQRNNAPTDHLNLILYPRVTHGDGEDL